MANYSAIKAAVNAYIKANGRKEITGMILNSVLNATIDSLGRFFQFAGGAIPADDPGTPDQNVCYLATEPGVYTNFGGITIENEEVALLFWNGTWTKQRILIGIREVTASVDNNVGTPSVDVSYSAGVLVLTFHNLKGEQGETGDPAGFGTIGADVTGGVGTPGVSVETSGGNDAKNIMFHFTNLKGETGVTSVIATIDNTTGNPSCQVSLADGVLTLAFSGLKGLKGDTGVSADYPITIYNGLDSDATDQALSAAQGKVLDGKVTQLEAKVTELATSVNDADYAIRAATSSSSLVDNPSGTRVRIVFKVNAGDTIRLSTTYLSGYSVGIWDTPGNCVYASTNGLLQSFTSGYVATPIVGVANYSGYLGVSFTNGNTAISDDLFAQILASLSVYIGGSVADRIHNVELVNTEQDSEINGISGDVYAEPLVSSTTTNALTPSSYVNKSGGPIEDTTQVMPAGAKLTKVKLLSTGAKNTVGYTFLYIYDASRVLVRTVKLGYIEATDTEFDVSSQNIIIQSGYHYAFDRVGYKYDTSIPNGRFLIASSGNQTDTKSWFGWTFTYETPQTKLDEFIADNSDLFDKSLRINNPLMPSNYSSYANGNPVEDLWQDLPVGAKLTKVHCSTRGAAGGNYTFLHIYDETKTQVDERIQLGQIQATDTIFDISAKNIIVQEGYHYCIQYAAAAFVGTNVNHYRYYTPSNDSYPYSGYQFGFSFEFETTKDQRPETELSGKYASFIGDSICEGAGCPGGYALLMARKYGMLPPQNNGSSGAIVTSIASESGRVYINTMVDKMDGNADFYIAEGGVNDADLSAPLGALSSGYTAELDTATFYGAMETLCKELATLHHGKKVGYIFAHRVSLTTKYAYDYTGENNYYRAAKECCEKWGIPFLDLNKHCPPLGCVASLKSSYTNNGDGYHPNEAGYTKYYVDRVAAWMRTL